MFNSLGDQRELLRGVRIVPEPFESIDSTLRRFKKAVQNDGILTDARVPLLELSQTIYAQNLGTHP